jgi:hypothetical protein
VRVKKLTILSSMDVILPHAERVQRNMESHVRSHDESVTPGRKPDQNSRMRRSR